MKKGSTPHSYSHRFLLGVLLLVAWFLRVWSLDIKPPHFDEGINGHFVAQIWREGFYRYDPTNFHGPLYFYFLQFAELFFGRNIVAYRFMNSFLAIALIVTVAMHRRFFGKAALWAAAVIALSPAFVFYSRYAIHETLFVLCQVLFSYGFFLWWEEKSRRAVTWMTLGFFGTFATKETFFIYFGTWAIALGCVFFAERILPSRQASPERMDFSRIFKQKSFLGIIGLGFFAVIVLFSGLFMNMKGLGHMFSAFSFWTHTGTGATGHDKPFMYWLTLLSRYELPCLVALVLSPLIFLVGSIKERIVVLAGFGTWLAYSLIPYKTPWLIMNILWLLALTLGIGWNRRVEIARLPWLAFFKPALLIAILVAIVASSQTMWRLNFRDYTNSQEPYVYVQSTQSFKLVMDLIEKRVKDFPEDLNMQIRATVKDPWPLPWMLGIFPNLQWGIAENANLANADVILIDSGKDAALEARLLGKYWKLPFQMRDGYIAGHAYLSYDRFKDLVHPGTRMVGPGSAGANL